jgi:energy-coupling factor transporter ATP-binding protein EcfA2
MLTRIQIKNFKKLKNVEIELGKSVVLIGPNNSGKTAALQALALWEIGLRRWEEKRGGKVSPAKRPGVTINRKDLISIPVPDANLLWNDLRVRDSEGKTGTKNIRIDITVDGITEGREWSCGLEFDYGTEEAFYCRPIRKPGFEDKPVTKAEFTTIPEITSKLRIAYLPPMSGLAAIEPKLEPGRINVLVGEGQTAQVLRNLCYQIFEVPNEPERREWKELSNKIKGLFGVDLKPPKYIAARGEIIMEYEEPNKVRLDLSSSGRGLQQTLLLLAYLYVHPNTVLLLDEPDAHLEVLRQRQIYQLLTEVAERHSSQIIAASHSEIILNEAADKDIVIAFVGKPHRIDDRGSQVLKALREIGFDQYYLAEQTGWVLYLEGSTDLAILQKLAKTLEHKAANLLERPFVYYVGNIPQKAYDHFYGLKEAYPDLVGIAIFDKLEKKLEEKEDLRQLMWQRRELENYICTEEVLLHYARGEESDDLFGAAEAEHRVKIMKESIGEVAKLVELDHDTDPWSPDIKATDDFLDRLFKVYYKKLKLPNLLSKNDYHILAGLVPKKKIDSEITEKLGAIVEVAKRAKPREY